jgi:hypothetical protein
MDFIRSLDWGIVHALASFTGAHVWVALLVMVGARERTAP